MSEKENTRNTQICESNSGNMTLNGDIYDFRTTKKEYSKELKLYVGIYVFVTFLLSIFFFALFSFYQEVNIDTYINILYKTFFLLTIPTFFYFLFKCFNIVLTNKQ